MKRLTLALLLLCACRVRHHHTDFMQGGDIGKAIRTGQYRISSPLNKQP